MAMAEAEPDSDAKPTPPVRPALSVLQDDQRALIRPYDTGRSRDEHALRAGFPDRRTAIEWYQRAIVRTKGHIADAVGVEAQLTYKPLLDWLIPGRAGDERVARLGRELFEAEVVLPACNRAYNDLRKVAGEYIGDQDGRAWTDLDPEGQQHVAMRPGFQRVDAMQASALRELWGGFPNREALFNWLHGLDEPTNGAVRADLAGLVNRSPRATRYLLDEAENDEKARYFRERFAIGLLLPAFVAGVDRLSPGELASRPRRELEPIQT